MFSNNLRAQQMENIAMINYLSDSIDRTFGLPPQGPRIQLPPQAVVNNAPVTNNINVDRSVVGAINTAQVARIDVAMNNIENGGNEEVAFALKTMTEAVINSQEIEAQQKDQLVEQLVFLAEQATLPSGQQQKSVINMVLGSIPAALATLASLSTLWTQYGPTIQGFFGNS